MKRFKTFLVEKVKKDLVVVFSGRFNPFHQNHFSTYQHLVKKFGEDKVFIGTSDKVEKPKSPLKFKEKVNVITTMFPIKKDKIVQIKNPYKPEEVLKNYSDDTAYVTAVGEKDAERLTHGKYFETYKDGIKMEGYQDKGYVYIVPLQTLKYKGKLVSGTLVREHLSDGDEEFFKTIYPKFDKKIFDFLVKKIGDMK